MRCGSDVLRVIQTLVRPAFATTVRRPHDDGWYGGLRAGSVASGAFTCPRLDMPAIAFHCGTSIGQGAGRT